MLYKDLPSALSEISDALNDTMHDLLPEQAKCGEHTLLEAMRYVTLGEGKKLRPFLVVTAANLFGVAPDSALRAASAIEFIHVYSLTHDDLPAMDNDDMRRGKPSCHKQFSEAAAILTGDALLTLAFEVLSDSDTHSSANVRCELINTIAKAAGTHGMVGGQMMDIEMEGKDLSVNEITHLQRMKTGALFTTSCEAGAILGKASDKQRLALRGFANAVGLAFQITDDLLDVLGTREKTGKTVNKDDAAGKATLVASLGVDKARQQAEILVDQAKTYLNVFDKRADILRELADFVIQRKH